jgi:hypothetical protein
MLDLGRRTVEGPDDEAVIVGERLRTAYVDQHWRRCGAEPAMQIGG